MSHQLPNLKSQRSATPITDLAKKANVSDYTIVRLEDGGAMTPDATQRIADALGVSLVTLGKKDF